jgi:hypothetical protein
MKSFILITTLLASICASAAEVSVMDINSSKVVNAQLSSRFEVNLQDGSAGVSVSATKWVRRGREKVAKTVTFEKLVPELALVNDKLMLGDIECGTMGETRVFRRPVLNLSGKCDIVTKREGKTVKVSIVTE